MAKRPYIDDLRNAAAQPLGERLLRGTASDRIIDDMRRMAGSRFGEGLGEQLVSDQILKDLRRDKAFELAYTNITEQQQDALKKLLGTPDQTRAVHRILAQERDRQRLLDEAPAGLYEPQEIDPAIVDDAVDRLDDAIRATHAPVASRAGYDFQTDAALRSELEATDQSTDFLTDEDGNILTDEAGNPIDVSNEQSARMQFEDSTGKLHDSFSDAMDADARDGPLVPPEPQEDQVGFARPVFEPGGDDRVGYAQSTPSASFSTVGSARYSTRAVAAGWTGARTPQEKINVVVHLGPQALSGAETLISAIEAKRLNSPEAQAALDNLRNLRSALDDLIQAVEGGKPLARFIVPVRKFFVRYTEDFFEKSKLATVNLPLSLGVGFLGSMIAGIPFDATVFASSVAVVTAPQVLKK